MRRTPMMRTANLRTLALAGLLLGGLTLAGCSSGADESSTEPGMVAPGGVAEDRSGEVSNDGATSAEYTAEADREVIVTGYMTVTVDTPAEAAGQATTVVERAGGHIDSLIERSPSEYGVGSAELTVRIPADELTGTLDELAELGEVEERSLAKQDVTSVAQDLDARIEALEASVDRLLGLMSEATTTADLITIESALSERQANLESLQSQRDSLSDQVEFSTITLYLQASEDAPVDEPDTFWSGLTTGWSALVAFFSFLLVAVGVLLPWLMLPAVVAVVVIAIVATRRRRARDAAAAAPLSVNAPAGPAPGAGEADSATPTEEAAGTEEPRPGE